MARRRQLYEGKAKILFEGPEPGTLVQYFKDDATAFNAQKKGTITGKGVLNNRISEFLMMRLAEINVPTHFIRRLNMREQLIKEVEIIPIEVVVRNIAAGSLSSRLGIAEGTRLPRSIVEYYYKNDQLGDPMVAEEHITAFGWATPPDMDDIVHLTLRINDFLTGLFLGVGITLVDFKLEFGRLFENEDMRIVLADEISPAVGQQDERENGQGPLQARPGQNRGSLPGSGAKAGDPTGGRLARHEGPGDDAVGLLSATAPGSKSLFGSFSTEKELLP
jgi:phosphoribosylaminoimidazole-succinocarboxamide synthase